MGLSPSVYHSPLRPRHASYEVGRFCLVLKKIHILLCFQTIVKTTLPVIRYKLKLSCFFLFFSISFWTWISNFNFSLFLIFLFLTLKILTHFSLYSAPTFSRPNLIARPFLPYTFLLLLSSLIVFLPFYFHTSPLFFFTFIIFLIAQVTMNQVPVVQVCWVYSPRSPLFAYNSLMLPTGELKSHIKSDHPYSFILLILPRWVIF